MLKALIYCRVPCPKCGKDDLPLRAWIVGSDYDEDGHANNFVVDQLDCHYCGTLLSDSDDDPVETTVKKIENAYWRDETVEVGTIRDYYPGLFSSGKTG